MKATSTKITARVFQVVNCRACPNLRKEPVDSGSALDYFCTGTSPKKVIAHFVEYSTDGPQNYQFPDWCPLKAVDVDPLSALPPFSVVQDPDSTSIFWTKDRHGVWVPKPKRSSGMLSDQLGTRKPEVLFVPDAKNLVWDSKFAKEEHEESLSVTPDCFAGYTGSRECKTCRSKSDCLDATEG